MGWNAAAAAWPLRPAARLCSLAAAANATGSPAVATAAPSLHASHCLQFCWPSIRPGAGRRSTPCWHWNGAGSTSEQREQAAAASAHKRRRRHSCTQPWCCLGRTAPCRSHGRATEGALLVNRLWFSSQALCRPMFSWLASSKGKATHGEYRKTSYNRHRREKMATSSRHGSEGPNSGKLGHGIGQCSA